MKCINNNPIGTRLSLERRCPSITLDRMPAAETLRAHFVLLSLLLLSHFSLFDCNIPYPARILCHRAIAKLLSPCYDGRGNLGGIPHDPPRRIYTWEILLLYALIRDPLLRHLLFILWLSFVSSSFFRFPGEESRAARRDSPATLE